MKSFSFTKITSMVLLILIACSSELEISNDAVVLGSKTVGTGFFNYTVSMEDKPIKVYFHIPQNANPNSPLVFVFHGNGVNAKDYRDAIIAKANQYGFVAIAPEFSNTYFTTGDDYNFGNVLLDADNQIASTLNPKNQWTFSVIEPLFDFIRESLNNMSIKYHIIGHSARSQFAHRLAMFKPNGRYAKVVASASGWYTVTDLAVKFPYDFTNSTLSNLFDKQLIVQI